MSSAVLQVDDLSKQYRLGTLNYGVLYRDIQSRWARIRGKEDPNSRVELFCTDSEELVDDKFWALKDLTFEVGRGEKLGIIGRNGAGKSTLLKIISKITMPTSGVVRIKGRVASLLEVGTGFHPELTGRENVYLNGAILGMRKKEIDRKFDEIAEFSGVEKFIDTPVKRYSSGMYVRLAFAVAAHLEPEILVVDEVLAVGDSEFQKKCLGKMNEVSEHGRTVLFVSHNMQAISSLCSKSVLLDKGKIVSIGKTDDVLNSYNLLLKDTKVDAKTSIGNEVYRRGSGAIRFTSVEGQDVDGKMRFNFEMGETVRFKMTYEVFKEMQGLMIYVALRAGMTREIVTSLQHLVTTNKITPGTVGTVVVELPDIYIRPGEYPLYFHLSDANMASTSVDVLDDLTLPLVITAGHKVQHSNFDPARPIGYYSMPSQIVYNEINGVKESLKC
jgi:lipopolysaccharide transport system ATP-binding protein